LLLLLALYLLFSSRLLAQEAASPDSTQLVRVILKDGSELIGSILKTGEQEIELKAVAGFTVAIPRVEIEKVEMLKGTLRGGRFLPPDPNNTCLFFAPTGRSLPQGEGYFAVYWVFFPTIAIGVTDWLALSGGYSLFPGAENQIAFFAPKVRLLHLPSFDLASGLLYLHVPFGDEGTAGGCSTAWAPLATPTEVARLAWDGASLAASSQKILSSCLAENCGAGEEQGCCPRTIFLGTERQQPFSPLASAFSGGTWQQILAF
jgi:hypothetical protein